MSSTEANVLRAGPLTTVQDLGRFGQRPIGVGTGGALDNFAARVANLLVGNGEADALLEVTLGNFRMRFHDERLIAWCGGAFQARIGKENIPVGHACCVGAGDEFEATAPQFGCRFWLALSGGVEVARVLGSRSTDLRAEFGGFNGRALRDGDDVSLGEMSATSRTLLKSLRGKRLSNWSAQGEWANTAAHHPMLRFVPGADWDRFDNSAHDILRNEKFNVTSEADRMGVRLEGPELKRKEASDLSSEAVAPGTIQVPPNGKPIVLLGDCQTVGGYPKIAHVITVDLPAAALLRPGDEVRFQETTVAEAHSLLLKRENDFALFRIGLGLKIA